MLWSQITEWFGQRGAASIPGAYVGMALNAMVYLDLGQYAGQLLDALGADDVQRYGGQGVFRPHILQVSGSDSRIVAFEGTRTWQQWATYVTGQGDSVWPYGPGRVFTPFLSIFTDCPQLLLDHCPRDRPVIFTGHSLGAACAGFAARWWHDVDRPTKVAYCLACPRCVNQRWVDWYRVPTYVVNHPYDPVPLIPTDPAGAMVSNPFLVYWTSAFRDVGQPFCIPYWSRLGGGTSNLDAVSCIANSAADFRVCPHQTYRYLRDLKEELTPADRDQLGPLTTLLQSLGLLDPWPAGLLVS